MSEISAAKVKELREMTGAGMMDCKKALQETDGHMDEAVDWLRKKGLSAAAKKAGRVASEGLVGAMAQGTKGAVIEVNSETDFVGRNDLFQGFVRQTGKIVMDTSITDIDILKDKPYGSGRSVGEELTHLIASIGENMSLRRAHIVSVDQGVVVSYTHNAVGENVGRLGVLVALESPASADKLTPVARQIAMHVAAASPLALSIQEVDPALVQKEKDILTEQAKASGRPADIIEKMVEGRLRKFYEESVLLEQVFVVNPDLKVSQVIDHLVKDVGQPVILKGFVRFALGEGIEKAQSNFADDVAAMSKA